MSSYSLIDFDISLCGNRFLTPADNYQFRLKFSHLVINNVTINRIKSIKVSLGNQFYEIPDSIDVPGEVSYSLILPARVGSWYPNILINGIDQYGYTQQLLLFSHDQ